MSNMALVGIDAGSIGEELQRLVLEPEPGQQETVLRDVVATGASVHRVVQGVIDVEASVDVTRRLTSLLGIRSVASPAEAVETAAYTPVTTPPDLPPANAYGGEGAAAVGVASWRRAGFTGSGVRVAVIDSGFADWDRVVAVHELAADKVVARHNYCDQGFERTSHGTATSEILFDMVPDAELILVCIDDALDLAQAVDALLSDGVQVVNMSLGFYNTSRGDGSGGPASPDDSVRRAIRSGILWVNSSGNEAQVHNSATFRDTNGNGLHEFAPGDETMAFTVPAHGRVDVYVKWDEWGARADDFDVCLGDGEASTPRCFASKVADRGLPTAALGLTSPYDQPIELRLSIKRRAGVGLPRIDTFVVGASSLEYPVGEGSLAEPASAPDVVSVGAVCTSSGELRPYSSRGPTIDGRPGVTLAAPGSVSGFLAGAVNGCEGNNGGTSTAAPHVAGALALVRQGFPALSGRKIIDELLARAERTVPSGQADPATGFGLLDLGSPPSRSDPPEGGEQPAIDPPPTAEGFGLGLSDGADRGRAVPFADATLKGDAFVFLTPVFPSATNPEQVRFSIDGVLVQVEKLAGYDVGGGGRNQAFPFDTFRLANGRHRLRADLRFGGGRIVSISAPFSVDNSGRTAAAIAQLVAGPAGGPLDGRLLAGPTAISLRLLDPAAMVHHILFYIDADLAGYHDAAPYGLGPNNAGQTFPFDVNSLGVGQHMIQAILYLADGRVVTANASFSVA